MNTSVSPLFLSLALAEWRPGVTWGKQAAGSPAEVSPGGPSILRHLLGPGLANYAVREEICFLAVGKRASTEGREGQRGRTRKDGGVWDALRVGTRGGGRGIFKRDA